jgi:hypothetical protein
LHNTASDIVVSLNREDAHEIFHSLSPISARTRQTEILKFSGSRVFSGMALNTISLSIKGQ